MPVSVSDSAEFTAAIVDRLQGMIDRGRLPADRWSIDGPRMPQIHVQGTATTYTAQVGESEVTLRKCDIYQGRSNPDWIYSISVTRNDVVISHDVTDHTNTSLGRLVEAVTDLCRPLVSKQRAESLAEFDVSA